ncbi:MAG: hypothetical protein HOK65_07780 [Crocinitomicaceae bacterium]|jgi:5'-3' exonuclease|nr:hypothetical protein [Crocinitomicaceae bacterium]
MGVENLLKEVKKHNNIKEDTDINLFKNKTIGVDISIYINRALYSRNHAAEIARLYTLNLNYYLYVTEYLKKNLLPLIQTFGMELILIFDGQRNPLKKETNEKRAQKFTDAEKKFNEYWKNEAVFRPHEYDNLAKGCVTPTEDIYDIVHKWALANSIKCHSAPIEAEWQLVSMEAEGLIEAILSIDSDILALGGKKLISSINFKTGTCTLITSIHLEKCMKEQLQLGEIQRADVLNFLQYVRCDYDKGVTWKKNLKNFKERKCKEFNHVHQQFHYPVVFKASEVEVSLKTFDTIEGKFVDVKKVEYDPVEVLRQSCSASYAEMYHLKVWCRTGKPFEKKEFTMERNIDFEVHPVKKHKKITLIRWLSCHGRPLRGEIDRQMLIRCVETIYKSVQGERGKSKPTMAYDWVSPDIIMSEFSPWVFDLEIIRKRIISFEPIDEKFLLHHFGVRNGVRARSISWFLGGHLNISTLRLRQCQIWEDTSGTLLTCNITPSQRCTDYIVSILFIQQEQNQKLLFLPPPGSRCPCKAGTFFCAHVVAMLLFIAVVQKYGESEGSLSDILSKMPAEVKSIQSYPIPWHFVFGRGGDSNQKIDALIKMLYSPPKVAQKSEKQVNEEEAVELKELTGNDTNESPLDIIASALEIMGENANTTNKRERKPVKKNKRERKPVKKKSGITKEELNEANDEICNRGPNGTTTRKLEQLKMHERLHLTYENNELPPNQFSHYLKLMQTQRKAMIKAIEDEDVIFFKNGNFGKSLMNIPVGWTVLADRGFAFDATKYPNFNRHITPHFIKGRDQFEKTELMDDLLTCQLRYISETHFSRVTDETSLRDIVAYDYFTILQHIVDVANGMANLKQPFYQPNSF